MGNPSPRDPTLGGNGVGIDPEQAICTLTICRVVNRDPQLVTLPEHFALEVIIQEDVDSVCKIGTMEWSTDKGESDIEDEFALGEGDPTLVKTRGGAYFAESSNKVRKAQDGPVTTNALMLLWREIQSLELSGRYLLVVAT